MTQIVITHNGQQVNVGKTLKDTAWFYITPARYFKEANACGFDKKLLKRVGKYKYIYFQMFSGPDFKIYTDDFLANAWPYPRNDSQYRDVFAPKLVLTLVKLAELNGKRRDRDEEELEEQIKYNL